MAGAEPAAVSSNAQWLVLDTVVLPANSRRIALIHQNAADVSVALELDGQRLFMQDGADDRYGTEVLALDNASAQPRTFRLSYAAHHKNSDSAPSISYMEAPDAATFAQAQAMSRAAQQWLGEKERETALTSWQQLAGDGTSAFHDLAQVNYLTGLQELGRNQALLDWLDANHVNDSTDNFPAYYMTWLKSRALARTGNDQAAQKLLQLLVDNSDRIDNSAAAQQIVVSNVLNDYGFGIVARNFETSDVKAMQAGGDSLKRALAISEPYQDMALTGALQSQVAFYQATSGDWEGGLKSLYLAEKMLAEAQSLLPLSVVRANIAFHYMRRGLVREAQDMYRDALQILEANPSLSTSQLSTTYARLALTYKLTGAYSKAETYFTHAADLYTQVKDTPNLLDTRRELGELRRLRGEPAKALELHLALANDVKADAFNAGWLRLHVELLRDYLALGKLREAGTEAKLLQDYRDDRTRNGEAPSRVPAYNLDLAGTLADYQLLQGNYKAAQTELKTALATLTTPLQESERQLQLTQLLSVAQHKAGDINGALRTGRTALAMVEANRTQIDVRGQGAAWNSHVNSIATHQAGLLLERYLANHDRKLLDEAFLTLQKTRAINLRQSQLMARLTADKSRSQLQLQSLWQQMADDKRALLAASVQKLDTRALQAKAIRSEEAYRAYSVEPGADKLPPLGFLTLPQLQKRLGNDSALFFSLEDERGFAVQVTAAAVTVVKVPGSKQLATLAKGSLAEMNTGNGTGSFTQSFALSKALFGTLQPLSGTVLIEGDGLIGQLPLAALPTHDKTVYSPLLLSATLVNLPSFSAYFDRPSASAGAANRLQAAILADPDFTAVETPFVLAAAETGKFERWRSGLQRLPYTAVEAGNLLKRFPANTARLYSGAQATLPTLLSSEVRNARLVHLASHGFSSTTDPDQVGFLLTAPRDNPAAGFLTSEDINNARFNNDLIVISGCATAIGEQLDGEYMLGLSRAFLAQGAKAVLATLWPISDRATADFMEYFYEELLDKRQSAAVALQKAQSRMLRNPDYRHPLYWAPFALFTTTATAAP